MSRRTAAATGSSDFPAIMSSKIDSILFDISRELGLELVHGVVVVVSGKYLALLIHHQLPDAIFESIAYLIWHGVRRDADGYV
jgi:hypothetical protein